MTRHADTPYLDAFLDMLAAERNAAANTLAAYGRDLSQAAAYFKRRGKELDKITGPDVARYLASLSRLAARSRARKLAALRQYFRFLASENFRADDPCAAEESPRLPQNLPGVLTAAEMQKLLESVGGATPENLRLRALLELAYGSGLRVSEMVALPLAAFEAGKPALLVRGKGGRERLVPLSAAAQKAVAEWLPHRAAFIPGKAKGKKASPFLFPSRGRSGHLTRMRFWQILRDAARKAGLPPAKTHPHGLRHAFATHLLQGGADLRALQTMLGHADIATTQIYTHLAGEHLAETVQKHHPLARKKG